MLTSLKIKNYAIIRDLEIDLTRGLNIITGETGAGKSILLGALGLILGKRADSKSLFDQEQKCIVEGEFEIEAYQLEDFFASNDLDYEMPTIVRREIHASGKSRAFINDSPVRLDTLATLGHKLVNIHSQHDTLDLNDSAFQTRVIDTMAGSEKELVQYQASYEALRTAQKELEELRERIQKAASDRDYLQFQLDELIEADLEEVDQPRMESELNSLNNAETIKQTLYQVGDALDAEQVGVLTQLRSAISSLYSLVGYSEAFEELTKRVESAQIELQDIHAEVEKLSEQTVHDPEQISHLSQRLDRLFKLQQKHQTQDVQGLIELRDEIDEKLYLVDEDAHAISRLEAKAELCEKELRAKAKKLTAKRTKAAPAFEKAVNKSLTEIGMPNAKLEVNFQPQEPALNGCDAIQFLFAANKGGQFQPLRKVASGGELSRLMLVIKSLLASRTAMPTLIFDEIDTGVSGEVGRKVGQLMRELATHHQLIAITHLPQIAGMGHQHFHVYKESDSKRTETGMRLLDEDDRILEIAKMLSGESPTPAAMENARELMG